RSDRDEDVIGGSSDERSELEHVVGKQLVDPGPVEPVVGSMELLDRCGLQLIERSSGVSKLVELSADLFGGHAFSSNLPADSRSLERAPGVSTYSPWLHL